jgi:hypothetical protein
VKPQSATETNISLVGHMERPVTPQVPDLTDSPYTPSPLPIRELRTPPDFHIHTGSPKSRSPYASPSIATHVRAGSEMSEQGLAAS